MKPILISNETLSDIGRVVLQALCEGPVAWRTPAELAADLGWDLDTTCDVLADLDVAGWIAVWERPDALVVTLTPLAAARLGVGLLATAPDTHPRWVRAGHFLPPPASRRRSAPGRDRLEDVPDDQPAPDAFPDAPEGATRRRRDSPWRRPVHLIGLSRASWPGPQSRPRGTPCPVCGSNRLRPDAYCLWCDRWGCDTGNRNAPRRCRPGPAVSRQIEDAARARRQARRRARRAAEPKSAILVG